MCTCFLPKPAALYPDPSLAPDSRRSARPQVLALQPNNRQAQEELRALRDVPDELDADLARPPPDMQELFNM